MGNNLQIKTDSILLNFSLVFLASLVIPSCYVYFAISPGLKVYWFGVALVISLISSTVILLSPLNKKSVYIPASILLSVILYNAYMVYF